MGGSLQFYDSMGRCWESFRCRLIRMWPTNVEGARWQISKETVWSNDPIQCSLVWSNRTYLTITWPDLTWPNLIQSKSVPASTRGNSFLVFYGLVFVVLYFLSRPTCLFFLVSICHVLLHCLVSCVFYFLSCLYRFALSWFVCHVLSCLISSRHILFGQSSLRIGHCCTAWPLTHASKHRPKW